MKQHANDSRDSRGGDGSDMEDRGGKEGGWRQKETMAKLLGGGGAWV